MTREAIVNQTPLLTSSAPPDMAVAQPRGGLTTHGAPGQ
ncbi:unnamed protein product [Staurois parvus]|uniref:Uncharacterized protein n=1 Tax=Staurois parvus TaxID=386267 RepID=A0ABN9G2G5_9NEOB|nr:unnamed protein product [Staurois parvus]